MKLDVFYNDLLQSVITDQSDYVSEKKLSKRQSSKYICAISNNYFIYNKIY